MKIFSSVWLWISQSGFVFAFIEGMNIHGHSGKYVVITCSHKWASTNIKYFCTDTSVLVSSDQSHKGRYRLTDFENGTFIVNITDLQESDSGLYWCGVKRAIKDTYNEVTLTVSKDSSIAVSTQPYKEAQTSLDWHTTTPAAAHSGSPSTPASLTSRDSTPDALKRSALATVSVQTSHYFVGGLVFAAILFSIGLVTVRQCRKSLTTPESARATSVSRNNTCDNAEKSTEMKSTDSTEVRKSQTDSIYQKLNLSKIQIYGVYGKV